MDGLRVLVVDDDDAVREVASEMLGALNCAVTCQDGGPSGIEAAGEAAAAGNPFDIIFLGIGMPVMTGIEVHRQLRSTLPAQKIIFMTGFTEDDLLDSSDEATWVLLKPFSMQSLTDIITQIT